MAPLTALETKRQRAHYYGRMSKEKSKSAKGFKKPAHWTNDPPPKPKAIEDDEELSPTRYGDWESKGIAIDF